MAFGLNTLRGSFVGEKEPACIADARICSMVSLLTTQQVAALVRCGCRLGCTRWMGCTLAQPGEWD